MSDEKQAPVPPGWVRLHNEGTEQAHIAPVSAWRYQITPFGGVLAWHSGMMEGRLIDVMESPAEVAALIAEAQAAERRATVVAVVTSPSQGDAIVAVTADGTCWAPSDGRMQPVIAGIDLDAIERREGE